MNFHKFLINPRLNHKSIQPDLHSSVDVIDKRAPINLICWQILLNYTEQNTFSYLFRKMFIGGLSWQTSPGMFTSCDIDFLKAKYGLIQMASKY